MKIISCGATHFMRPRWRTLQHTRTDRREEMTAMDSTKVIADLCAVIDRMNVIIQAQAMELAQFGALAHEEEIAAVRRQYARAVGEGVGP